MEDRRDIVYCSGPLFCPEEIGGMTAIAEVLEKTGYSTFVPHRDGLEYYLMGQVNSPMADLPVPKKLISRIVFSLDVYQIVERCDSFVMNFNGRVPDEGAVAEAGIAFASGTPLIIYKNDNRTVFNGADNGMVTGLSHAPLVSDIQKIPGVLKTAVEAARGRGGSPYKGENIPPIMRDTIDLGRKVWKTMGAFRLNGGDPKRSAELITQIAAVCKDHPSLDARE